MYLYMACAETGDNTRKKDTKKDALEEAYTSKGAYQISASFGYAHKSVFLNSLDNVFVID